jgi:protein-tyrosine phosphatase
VSPSLRLETAPNFRDFGGHAAGDGRRVRTGMLFRSSQLSGLSDADLAAVDALGIRCVIDLRALDERIAQPARWGEAPAFRFESGRASLAEDMKASLAKTNGTDRVRDAFSAFYASLPELYVVEYRALFERLAAGDVPLLVNCTAGKDRTGVASALILSALGVARETVVADYVETNARFGDLTSTSAALPVAGAAAAIVADHATTRASRDAIWAADPAFLTLALDAINRDHGSIEAYVVDRLGLGRDGLDAIRAALTEPA